MNCNDKDADLVSLKHTYNTEKKDFCNSHVDVGFAFVARATLADPVLKFSFVMPKGARAVAFCGDKRRADIHPILALPHSKSKVDDWNLARMSFEVEGKICFLGRTQKVG